MIVLGRVGPWPRRAPAPVEARVVGILVIPSEPLEKGESSALSYLAVGFERSWFAAVVLLCGFGRC